MVGTGTQGLGDKLSLIENPQERDYLFFICVEILAQRYRFLVGIFLTITHLLLSGNLPFVIKAFKLTFSFFIFKDSLGAADTC